MLKRQLEELNDRIATLKKEVATTSAALAAAAAKIKEASVENAAIRKERDTFARTVVKPSATILDLQFENVALKRELALARSNPILVWKESKINQALTFIAGSRLPISKRARLRFAKSARKRDPNRSLRDVILAPGEAAMIAEASLPVSIGGGQSLKGKVAQDNSRANVLVVSHEASFTGAPILAQNIMRVLGERYNVYAITIKGGDLIAPILECTIKTMIAGHHPERGSHAYRSLTNDLSKLNLKFAIVNSIEARGLLPVLKELDVPSLALIHEFASYTQRTAFDEVVTRADEIVFSSPLTLENAAEVAGMELAPNIHVFPQGKCTVPNPGDEVAIGIEQQRLRAHLRPDGHEDDFVVIGVGSVQIRKGVDLFIEVARQLHAKTQGRRVHFVWIGAGYDPEHELAYSVYLQDQLKRSGMTEKVRFLPPTSEIEYAYRLADVLLLPSRLDPLPNVAIDAMLAGTAVLCFDLATGIADVLREAGLGQDCVAAYLDPSDMSAKLAALAEAPSHLADVVSRTRKYAEEIFDMTSYVERLEGLILSKRERNLRQPMDLETIAAEKLFEPDYVLPPSESQSKRNPCATAKEVAQKYLSVFSTGHARRPEPGFNPHVYAFYRGNDGAYGFERDAYADFLAAGRPAGPWMLPVLRADSETQPSSAAIDLRTALHIHAYYVDQLATILDHLGANQCRPDLHVTVTGEAECKEALATLESYAGVHQVDIVPTVGRDIGPFLTGVGARLVANYDIVGHVHTKKSAALGKEALEANGRRFLYENTLGGRIGGAMLDRIVNAFADDPKLGIVFPSDPNLRYWSCNRRHAAQLVERLDVGPLPQFFDFPVGTMCWMRADALRLFVDMGLELNDYLVQPVAFDGNMLHALERLLGTVPALRGFNTAVTATKGLTR